MADNKQSANLIAPITPEAAVPDMPGPAHRLNVKEEVAPEKAALHEKDEALPNLGDNVVSFAAAEAEGPGTRESDKPEKSVTTPEPEKPQEAAKPRRGRPSKVDKAAPAKAASPKRDKMSHSKKAAEKVPPAKDEIPATVPNSRPFPVTLRVPRNRSRSCISIYPSFTLSKTIRSASGTTPRCAPLWRALKPAA